jgi:hypothetical protein
MKSLAKTDWSTGMITWIIGQNSVLLDNVAADLFGMPGDISSGLDIDTILAIVVEEDRARVAREMYGCIANGGLYEEEFDISIAGARQTVAMKGRAVGDILFTCMIAPTPVPTRPGRLLGLCLAAYDVARQENNDAAALQLIGAFNFIRPAEAEHVGPVERSHVH